MCEIDGRRSILYSEATPQEVGRTCGHANISQTDTYLNVGVTDLRKSMLEVEANAQSGVHQHWPKRTETRE